MQAPVCIHVHDARQMEPNPPARCQHQSNGITCSEVRTLIVKRVQLMQPLPVLPKKMYSTVSLSCSSIRQCNRPSYLSTHAASHVSACADRQPVHSKYRLCFEFTRHRCGCVQICILDARICLLSYSLACCQQVPGRLTPTRARFSSGLMSH